MRAYENDGSLERRTLIAMIVGDSVLAQIAPKWESDKLSFLSPWSTMIGQWCVDYFRRYGKAPQQNVKPIFEAWAAEKDRDSQWISAIESVLEGLSTEWGKEKLNADHLLDLAFKHFNEVRVCKIIEQAQGWRDVGKIEKAAEILSGYSRIDKGSRETIDIMRQEEPMRSWFVQGKNESLISYPGDLKKFFDDSLCREGFIAFQAPEKAGKSMCLIDLACRAVRQRRKVIFFEAGDSSQRQVGLRFCTRLTGQPFRSPLGRWPYVVNYPKSIGLPSKEGIAQVEYEEKTFPSPLTSETTWRTFRRLTKEIIKSKKAHFFISCHPNSTLGFKEIEAVLSGLELSHGFSPDVLVIDYADILAFPSGKMEVRDQINTVWKQLRGLSQKLHCLVVTATQANAKAYDKRLQSRKNFSEDKRKFAHVTGLIGINITAAEKEKGIMRLNWIGTREMASSWRRVVHVAGCLPLVRPIIKSVLENPY